MLACYLTWHLRRAWAPLTFTGQDPPQQDNPVTPARRSAAAQAKASYQHDPADSPTRLEQLGIHRNVEIMTQTFVMGPLLVRGTRLLAIGHERVALELAPGAGARILDLPFDLGTITQAMFWHPRMPERSRPPVA